MSRNLVAGSTQYLRHNALPAGLSATLTLACWFQANDLASRHTLIDVTNSGSDSNFFILRADGVESGNPIQFSINDGTGLPVKTSSGYTTGTWHHACGIHEAGVGSRVFLDGGNKGTTTSTRSPSGLNRMDIGYSGDSSPGFPLDGQIAEAAIWNAALTDVEVSALGAGLSPLLVRPGSLVAYWPLIGRYSPEIDLVGGFDMTLVNGPTVAEHPRMFYSQNIFASELTAASTLSTIRLAWQDNSDAEGGFSIERSSTSATAGFSEIDTVAADVTQYDDTDLSAGTYWYRVRAFDTSGVYSSYSNVAEVTVS